MMKECPTCHEFMAKPKEPNLIKEYSGMPPSNNMIDELGRMQPVKKGQAQMCDYPFNW